MSEEPEQNPRTEASKKKLNDAFELHKHIRASIGLNPFNILQRMKGGIQNFRAQQAQQNQGGNPGNPSNEGVQAPTTNSSRIRLDLGFGVLHPKPQPQAPPPTEEEKRAMVEQQKLKELEDKQLAAKAKRKRLDNMRGLSVDRT